MVLKILFFLLLGNAAKALPTEGFETFGLQKSRVTTPVLTMQFSYVNPTWISDYEQMDFYATHSFLGNYLTWGGAFTLANRWADRDAYFIRYDQLFWGQSFSLKLTHRDENYLRTGKNIISVLYNGSLNYSDVTQIYVSVGGNYRFVIDRWSTGQWNPINFNTNDQEFYFEATLGYKHYWNSATYFTLDVNNRDAFNSYNADFTAIDFAINFVTSNNTTWRLVSSSRISGFWMGTFDVGAQTVSLGLTTSL